LGQTPNHWKNFQSNFINQANCNLVSTGVQYNTYIDLESSKNKKSNDQD